MDRRKLDEAGDLPPVTALLRRLRVRITGTTAEDRRHALDMLKAAIGEANRIGWRQCAAALVDADQALRTGSVAVAEACVVRAIEHAGAGS